MAMRYLTATVRYRPRAAIIDLEGEFSHKAGEALDQAYHEVESHNLAVVFLNFGSVNYFNSGGIGLLISLLARMRQSNRSLFAYGLSAHILELLELSGLTKFLHILPSEANIPSCISEQAELSATNA